MPKPNRGFIKPRKFYPVVIDRIVEENQPILKNKWSLILLTSLVLLLIYILAVRFVYVETNVANSNVEIESFFPIKLSKYFLLLPGSHRIKISADGYYDLKSKLLVSKTKYQEHVLNLTKLPGKIELNIEPVDKVDVLIDGNKYGSTNKFILKVPAGKELLNFRQKDIFQKR